MKTNLQNIYQLFKNIIDIIINIFRLKIIYKFLIILFYNHGHKIINIIKGDFCGKYIYNYNNLPQKSPLILKSK